VARTRAHILCKVCSDFFTPVLNEDVLCNVVFTPCSLRLTKQAGGSSEMRTPTWKAVIRTLNPSPVFEAVAMFAEELATNDSRLGQNKSAIAKRDDHVTEINSHP
jgi:hypothetical protein